MKNKKGFTLVELLAVIAILAILVIMALPAVLRMFEQARVDSFNNELNTIIRTAKQQYLLEGGVAKTWTNAEGSTSKLDLTGSSDLKYSVTMEGNGKVTSLQATNGSYQYDETNENGIDIVDKNDIQSTSNLSESELLVIYDSSATTDLTFITRSNPGQTTVGDEVTLAGESFYILSENSSKIELIAKYDLKQDGSNYIQDTSGASTNIVKSTLGNNANIAYWDECKYSTDTSACTGGSSGLLSKYSSGGKGYCTNVNGTNCAYVYDSNSAAYSIVNAYASKLASSTGVRIIGRLPSLEEVILLNANKRKDPNKFFYLLGTPYSEYQVYMVNSTGGFAITFINDTGGIRPVIIINKSNTHVNESGTLASTAGTVTYSCNGGTGTVPSAVSMNSGTYTVSTLKPCKRIQTGSDGHVYSQIGWSNTPLGAPINEITVTPDGVILYAAWVELFSYSGLFSVYNDNSGDWRVEFTSSGALTVNQALAVDIHVVGGGGGGGGTALINYAAGGGSGGQTVTVFNRSLSPTTYNISVGVGGQGGSNTSGTGGAGGTGGTSSFGTIVFAHGGFGGTAPYRWGTGSGGKSDVSPNYTNYGSGGGSGSALTGECTGAGGTNGGNGNVGTLPSGTSAVLGAAGLGQGTTTRDFGETTGTLRAGGGGGGCGKRGGPAAAGGQGGGGTGGLYGLAGGSGTPNYGGGGGGGGSSNAEANRAGAGGQGGSGIVIMRNKR